MAEPRPGSAPPEGTCLRLTAGAQSVVVPARTVREVLAAYDLIPVPLTRPEVIGVLLRMSRAIPVYNLAALLEGGAPLRGAAPKGVQIVLVEELGVMAGFLTDRVECAAAPSTESLRHMDGSALLALAGAVDAAPMGLQAARAAEGER